MKFLIALLFCFFVAGCENADESPGWAGPPQDTNGQQDTETDSEDSSKNDFDPEEEPCIDKDNDHICEENDCDDDDPNVRPGISEVAHNSIDDDCDGETDEFEGPGLDQDQDGDGFTPNEGDCWDTGDDAEFINPNAIEDRGADGKGDGVDNDCDGETDESESDCDCPETGKDIADMARALGLCQDRFVLDSQMHTSTNNAVQGYDSLHSMGNNTCLVSHQGCEMAVISTGRVGQANPNKPISGMGGLLSTANMSIDPQPQFQGDLPTTAAKQRSCDRTQIRLRLQAPSNAVGFSFDFLFASAEYDEWINKSFNDTFYAILEYANVNNGATTNISFDSNGNEIEVDTNFFENVQYPCDEAGSGWSPAVPQKAGSTGWLRTSWDVKPGDQFNITFSIHDEGDCIYDSIAFIDNWIWHTEPVEPGTEEIIPEPPV
ncbi:MAG: hypothetical protein GY854_19035 [Deltaproteobacteria bacterium]|nr:hypothetical protein [Deltaproteobacteria bacterium]